MKHNLIVYFVEPSRNRFDDGWRAAIVRLFIRDFWHVAVGDGLVVLDPTHSGVRVWSIEDFESTYPNLSMAVEIPIENPPQIWPELGRISAVRAAMRFLSGGRVRCNDCVSFVASIMRECGIEVPHRTVHPRGLLDIASSRQGAVIRRFVDRRPETAGSGS